MYIVFFLEQHNLLPRFPSQAWACHSPFHQLQLWLGTFGSAFSDRTPVPVCEAQRLLSSGAAPSLPVFSATMARYFREEAKQGKTVASDRYSVKY
jgi:hypothetical protein